MKRIMRTLGLAGLLLAAGLAGSVLAQPGKGDPEVTFFDRATKKEAKKKGALKEGPGGLVLKVKEGKKETEYRIAPADVVTIVYPHDLSVKYRTIYFKEKGALEKEKDERLKKSLAEAMADYQTLGDELKTHPEGRRYAYYRASMLAVRLASMDPARKKDAIKMLKDFAADHKGGWQILPVLTTLARLEEDEGNEDGARSAYEQIALLPDIPKEAVRQSEVFVAKLYLRKGNFAEAEKRLDTLARSLSAGDADKPFIDAYLAEARLALGGPKAEGLEKGLAESLKATTDGNLKGVLHNLLGEAALKKGQNEQAFWHFLRVDAMYADLPEEQGKALHHLSTLFDTVKKDPARAKESLRRLAASGLEGTRYHKLAVAKLKKLEEEKEP